MHDRLSIDGAIGCIIHIDIDIQIYISYKNIEYKFKINL